VRSADSFPDPPNTNSKAASRGALPERRPAGVPRAFPHPLLPSAERPA
jgi:hypothetical protein